MTKQHIFLLVGGVGVIGAATAVSIALVNHRAPVAYPITSAQTRDVSESVTASGVVEPAQSVNLSFETGGRLAKLNVDVGSTVKVGQDLADLDNAAQRAGLEQASAALNARAAGATTAQVAVAKAAVAAAQADLAKTTTDVNAAVSSAQSEVASAENGLNVDTSGQSQGVRQAYQQAVTALQASIPKIDDALNQANAVIGADNPTVASNVNLSALDPSKLATAKSLYAQVKTTDANIHTTVDQLTAQSDPAAVSAAIVSAQAALEQTSAMLSSVSDVLNNTISGVRFPQAQLQAEQSEIQGTRSGVLGQLDAVIAAGQGIEDATTGAAGGSISLAKAQQDLANAQADASSTIQVKQAALAEAEANLQNVEAPARAVDLAPMRAAVDAANVALKNTILVSPIAGVVSAKNADVGAIVAPNMPVLSVIDPHGLQVDLLVSETDVAKLAIGQTASVTLDAYGAAVPFAATIVKIDPTQVTVNGASGYHVTLQFTQDDPRLKPGMTANATVDVASKSGVVAVPASSVIQQDTSFYVLKDTGGATPAKVPVTVGIRGNDGWDEITSGVSVGDKIVNFGS